MPKETPTDAGNELEFARTSTEHGGARDAVVLEPSKCAPPLAAALATTVETPQSLETNRYKCLDELSTIRLLDVDRSCGRQPRGAVTVRRSNKTQDLLWKEDWWQWPRAAAHHPKRSLDRARHDRSLAKALALTAKISIFMVVAIRVLDIRPFSSLR
jgi:hypothetical protein